MAALMLVSRQCFGLAGWVLQCARRFANSSSRATPLSEGRAPLTTLTHVSKKSPVSDANVKCWTSSFFFLVWAAYMMRCCVSRIVIMDERGFKRGTALGRKCSGLMFRMEHSTDPAVSLSNRLLFFRAWCSKFWRFPVMVVSLYASELDVLLDRPSQTCC
jgi:hypothetical protein